MFDKEGYMGVLASSLIKDNAIKEEYRDHIILAPADVVEATKDPPRYYTRNSPYATPNGHDKV
jgi:hypothetical protein